MVMPVTTNQEGQRGRVLRMQLAAERAGISRQLVYRKLDPKDRLYDADFPKKIKLSKRAVAFFECEIDAWLLRRQKESANPGKGGDDGRG